MSDAFQRTWRGPIKAVVFDWAGTTVDFGCCAPAGVFVEVFRRRGVAVPMARAREPMGTHKRTHLEILAAMPEVASGWQAKHGRAIEKADLDALYHELIELQLAVLPDYADPIPGALDAVAALRARGIAIGSTTGYIPEMLAVLREAAAVKGYAPDCAISAGEVPEGRPAPYLIFEAMSRLGVWPVQAVVKVGDTVSDIEAGLNAGVWSVGIAVTGNAVGLSEAEWKATPPADQAALTAKARASLAAVGAHYVIDTPAEVPALIEAIEARLRAG
ncbi:MAG: phosphonoacetaldehyde hydrolase, partial [Myxococcales bacterium]|nr:phosphonoacetaldehyde hydrolase [Myxococcales bacterium]